VRVEGRRTEFGPALRVLIADRTMVCFLITVFIMGMATSIIGNYLFLFLHDVLNGSRTLMGLSLTFTVLTEIPFFFFAKMLLNRVGIRGMIVLAHLGYVARVIGYTYLTNAWWVLPIELLHGLTFAAMWAAGVAFANNRAPNGLEATAQGLYTGVYSGM